MERAYPNSGEIFEPKTVVNKLDVSSESTICIPVIFDLKNRLFIWTDLALKRNPLYFNNIEGNANNTVNVSRAMVELSTPNLYDLFRLNVLARGELVETSEEADVTIGLDETDDITPYNVEKILSEFM
jgi:hypothetical protein